MCVCVCVCVCVLEGLEEGGIGDWEGFCPPSMHVATLVSMQAFFKILIIIQFGFHKHMEATQ